MGRIAVLGEEVRVAGYELAGALVLPADTPDEVERAWASLPRDVAVVVLTPGAADRLGARPLDRREVLTVVMPP